MTNTLTKPATAIDRVQEHLSEIVKPGMPAAFTAACEPGDGIWQGDLGLEICATVPAGYKLVAKPTSRDKQLVPGNTRGARHCLDSLDGVTLYRPQEWNEDSLQGPCLVLTEDREVRHPVHGTVTVLAGQTILCRYQREWDKEQAKARRAAD